MSVPDLAPDDDDDHNDNVYRKNPDKGKLRFNAVEKKQHCNKNIQIIPSQHFYLKSNEL